MHTWQIILKKKIPVQQNLNLLYFNQKVLPK